MYFYECTKVICGIKTSRHDLLNKIEVLLTREDQRKGCWVVNQKCLQVGYIFFASASSCKMAIIITTSKGCFED